MAVLSAPVFAAAIVVAIAGIAKLARPRGTVIALHAVGLKVAASLVSLLGLVELGLGVSVVFWPSSVLIAALGLFYLAFAVFSAIHLKKNGANASCGCFGAADTPVHPVHVAINTALVVACAAALIWPPSPVSQLSVALIGTTLILTSALIAVLTVLPQTLTETNKVLKATSR